MSSAGDSMSQKHLDELKKMVQAQEDAYRRACMAGEVRILIEFDRERPNLYAAFQNSRYVLPELQKIELPLCAGCGEAIPLTVAPSNLDGKPYHAKCVPEPEFEVNMMEALVGWKGWNLAAGGILRSPTYSDKRWKPCEPLEAQCDSGHKKVPNEKHCCGIYAADERQNALAYGSILGTVYGWGRYVRGSNGWRSQFAYPKEFFLKPEQMEYVEPLRAYGVPIQMMSWTQIYDPAEDGFERSNTDEHGQDNADWGCRAADDSSTEEG